MYSYFRGNVTDIKSNLITLECNNIGYEIYTPSPYSFSINKDYIVYTYQNVKEDSILLYGFKTKDEKDLFIKLLSVKGIGPKGAIAILATGSVNGVIQAIESGNADYLKKFPGIGPKASQQIILDLKGKIDFSEGILMSDSISEVDQALKALGYSQKEIRRVLPKLDPQLSTDELIKQALKSMLK